MEHFVKLQEEARAKHAALLEAENQPQAYVAMLLQREGAVRRAGSQTVQLLGARLEQLRTRAENEGKNAKDTFEVPCKVQSALLQAAGRRVNN